MPTHYDRTFFQIAVYNSIIDDATAQRCLGYIDAQAKQGRTFSAPQVLQSSGSVSAEVIAQLHQMSTSSLQQRSGQSSARSAAAVVPQASPAPSPPKTSRRHEPPADQPAAREEFEFVEKIGKGPVGATWFGRDPRGQGRALKILSSRFSRKPELRARILEEVRRCASAALDHPAVLAPSAPVGAGDRVFIPFQIGSSRATLRQLVDSQGALPQAHVVNIARQLVAALAHAHERGVSHGDLRAEKVLIDASSVRVQITDFGLAHASALANGFARVGVPFGHPTTLAPEVVQRRLATPTPPQDFYALGILLYELLTGALPFRAQEPRALLELHLRQPLPTPARKIGLHRDLAALLLELTAKDPRRRATDARSITARLDELARPGVAKAATPGPEADESIDEDSWARSSGELSEGSGDWSEERIRNAGSLEPEEWDPDAEEDDDLGTSATRGASPSGGFAGAKPGLVLELQSLAEQAAAPTPSPRPEAPGEPRKGSGRHPRRDPGDAGNRLELRGRHAENKARRARLVNTLIIGAPLALMGVLSPFLIVSQARSKTPKPEMLKRPPPPELTAQQRDAYARPSDADMQSFRERRDAWFARATSRASASRASKDWPALETLLTKAPNELRKDPQSAAKIDAMRLALYQSAREGLVLSCQAVSKLLAKGELEGAGRLLARVERGLITPTQGGTARLRKQLAEARAARAAAAAPKIRSSELLEPLAAVLYGQLGFAGEDAEESAEIRPDWLLRIKYDFTDPDQLRDFQHQRGKMVVGDSDYPGLFVTLKKREACLLRFALPVLEVERVDLRYSIESPLRGKSRLALALGISAFRPTRATLPSVDGQRFELIGDALTVRGKGRSRGEPWGDGPHLFSVGFRGNRLESKLDGKRLLSFRPEPLEGRCGIYVRDLNVRILSMELSVRVDHDRALAWAAQRTAPKR